MRLSVLCAAAIMMLAVPVAAEEVYPAQPLVSTGKTIVGEDIVYPTTGPAKVTAQIVTLAPGAETVLHHHPAPMFAYILAGEVTVDYGAAGKQRFTQGQAFVEAMNATHKGTNTGAEPVRILAVSMGADGTANVVADKP